MYHLWGFFMRVSFKQSKWLGVAMLATMLFSSANVFAQLVAFTGKDSNSPDEFAFVALQDIPDGTVIYFTESDYDNTADTFSTGEGHLSFIVSGTLSIGTVVLISESSVNMFTVTGNGGTAALVGASNWSITAADPLSAYASDTPATPWADVDEVYATMFASNAALGTRDPSANYPNAIVLDGFASQNAAVDFTGSRAATLASFSDTSNYTLADSDLDLTAFSSVPVELMSLEIE